MDYYHEHGLLLIIELTYCNQKRMETRRHTQPYVSETHSLPIHFPSVSPPFIQSAERLQRISSNDNVVTANSVQIALFVHQTFLRGRAALRSE